VRGGKNLIYLNGNLRGKREGSFSREGAGHRRILVGGGRFSIRLRSSKRRGLSSPKGDCSVQKRDGNSYGVSKKRPGSSRSFKTGGEEQLQIGGKEILWNRKVSLNRHQGGYETSEDCRGKNFRKPCQGRGKGGRAKCTTKRKLSS